MQFLLLTFERISYNSIQRAEKAADGFSFHSFLCFFCSSLQCCSQSLFCWLRCCCFIFFSCFFFNCPYIKICICYRKETQSYEPFNIRFKLHFRTEVQRWEEKTLTNCRKNRMEAVPHTHEEKARQRARDFYLNTWTVFIHSKLLAVVVFFFFRFAVCYCPVRAILLIRSSFNSLGISIGFICSFVLQFCMLNTVKCVSAYTYLRVYVGRYVASFFISLLRRRDGSNDNSTNRKSKRRSEWFYALWWPRVIPTRKFLRTCFDCSCSLEFPL